jgi:hypothetical protein
LRRRHTVVGMITILSALASLLSFRDSGRWNLLQGPETTLEGLSIARKLKAIIRISA